MCRDTLENQASTLTPHFCRTSFDWKIILGGRKKKPQNNTVCVNTNCNIDNLIYPVVLCALCVRRVVLRLFCLFLSMQNGARGQEPGLATSLHRLVQVAPLVGAEGVEGGHHKLAVKGSARQQPLGLFGVAGVAVFDEDLRGQSGWEAELQLGVIRFPHRCGDAPVRNISAL